MNYNTAFPNTEMVSSQINTVSAQATNATNIANSASNSVSEHSSNTTIHVSQADKSRWDSKADENFVYSKPDTENLIDTAKAEVLNSVVVVDNRVSTLNDVVSTLSGDVATVRNDVTALSSRVDSEVSTLNTAISDAEARVNEDIETLSTTVASLDTSVNGQISTLTTSVSNVDGRVTTISGQVNTLASDITTLAGSIPYKHVHLSITSNQTYKLQNRAINYVELAYGQTSFNVELPVVDENDVIDLVIYLFGSVPITLPSNVYLYINQNKGISGIIDAITSNAETLITITSIYSNEYIYMDAVPIRQVN